MKWLLIGGVVTVAVLAMRSRARADMPPEALPAPPVPGDIIAPLPVTVTTPGGETWEAMLGGTYFVTR